MSPPNDPGLKGLLDVFSPVFKSRKVARIAVCLALALVLLMFLKNQDPITVIMLVVASTAMGLVLKSGKKAERDRLSTPLETRYTYNSKTGAVEPYLYGNPNLRPVSPVARPSGEHGTARFQGAGDLAAAGFVDEAQPPSQAQTADAALARMKANGWTAYRKPDGGFFIQPPGEAGEHYPPEAEAILWQVVSAL